jgi:hypothetical protein
MTSEPDQPNRPVFSEQSQDPRTPRIPGQVLLIAVAGLVNFLFVPVLRGAERSEGAWLVAALGAGVLAGELGLATLWLVWGPGSFGRRLVVHWSVGGALYVCWGLGLVASFAGSSPPPDLPEMLVTILLALPIVSLAVQLPLWPLRTHFGWRIERSWADHSQPQSLSIRDLILATVVTSVSLACLRLMPTALASPAEVYWSVWGIAVAISAVASTLSLLPATVIVFRTRETAAAVITVITLAAYTAVAWIATCVLGTLFGGPAPAEIYIAILVCYGGFASTVGLPLLILRGDGYALTFASERKRPDV